MLKEQEILGNVRTVFRQCEKYFSFDEDSMRIQHILEKHFENELSVCPRP
jgi:hypothetical protein